MGGLPGLPALACALVAMEQALELDHVCFRDVAWLQSFFLDENTVLDYFALSQFYDRTCNNEVLKMQARFVNNQQLLSRLHTMTGIEFALLRADPPRLFIIIKQQRMSPERVIPIDCYYVLEGSIYKAPNLQAVLAHRLMASMHYLTGALEYARSSIVFDPLSGQYILKSTRQERAHLELVQRDELRIKQAVETALSLLDQPR